MHFSGSEKHLDLVQRATLSHIQRNTLAGNIYIFIAFFIVLFLFVPIYIFRWSFKNFHFRQSKITISHSSNGTIAIYTVNQIKLNEKKMCDT